MSKSGFSITDLQAGAKKLNTVEQAPSKTEKASAPDEADGEALKSLEELYDRFRGDLDEIFAELRADPTKAKKPHHRPKDAKEFARQYLAGYYSIIDSDDPTSADSKSSHK